MKTRIYLMSSIFLLGFLLFVVMKQFIADLYWIKARNGKEPQETIGYLEKCIAVDNKNALFRFSLGRAFLKKGLPEVKRLSERNKWVRKSIDELHKAIELKPSDSDYHFHLGLSYGLLAYPPAFYRRAIQNSFTRTAMLNSTDTRHLYSIGIYYLNEYDRLRKIGQNTDAKSIANYRPDTEISKDMYQSYFRKLVDVDEEYLTKILEKCFSVTQKYADLEVLIRDTARSRLIFARFLDGKGMWEEAQNQYMMAINLEPLNPIYYAEFANAFSSKGDFNNAITWWAKQKMVNPRDEEIYLSLHYGFMRLHRFDDALRELHELIKLNPENISYHVKLLRTLLAANRVNEAIDEYRKVIEWNQDFSKSIYDTVRDYQRKGDYDKAIRILDESLTLAVKR